jgi:lysine-ketoglutarate reductase/saccharopine dehydrogenase-like protein (TIGR00300 family)
VFSNFRAFVIVLLFFFILYSEFWILYHEAETMAFHLPTYRTPDFTKLPFVAAPTVTFEKVKIPGVAPENYHATSIYPEYLQLKKKQWVLLKESRMDCVVVREKGWALNVKEFRHLKVGDLVALGRGENGEEGIYIHTGAFEFPWEKGEKFSFRSRFTRETSFSIDYDELYDLLEHDRDKGFIVWVLGPAVVFDRDAREAFVALIEEGYVHALLAGNALAVHDLEGALFGTALGQEIYTKRTVELGHYKHLDAINRIRGQGSIEKAIDEGFIKNGIMWAAVRKGIDLVLAGSIRDDGPIPEVIGDAYQAQDSMRVFARRATTVIALATQLHAIATGNMVPSYQVMADNRVRPVYFYTVDMSEFAVNKLANRGTLTARSILTNVQDFVVTVERGLGKRCE